MNLTLSTPSRLHFGLFAVGSLVDRSFGGVGLMVSAPRTVIHAAASRNFRVFDQSADADAADRAVAVTNIAQKWFDRFGGDLKDSLDAIEGLPVELRIIEASPRHSGLGSGTQLAMATGLALQQFFRLPMPKPDELAIGLGRASRSAIGTYGCFEGGLIVDRGKSGQEAVSPIDLRVDFPEHWPIAIVRIIEDKQKPNLSPAGLHGSDEKAAFEKIPPTTPQQLQEMRALVSEQLVPGVLENSYECFANAVYAFGRRSGEYFSTIQGGPYASSTITEVIETIHGANVHATGQTSWGPSVFAIGESWEHLQPAIINLKKRFGGDCHIEITHADNRGVSISQHTESTA